MEYNLDDIRLGSEWLRGYLKKSDGNNKEIRPLFRAISSEVIKNISLRRTTNRLLIVHGPRGVGKTTLLSYLYFQALSILGEDRVLYFPMKDLSILNISIRDITRIYEYSTLKKLESLQEPVLFLFDDIHMDHMAELALKTLYDRSKNVFVVSTSLFDVTSIASPDLARRAQIHYIPPITFLEYLDMRHMLNPKIKTEINTTTNIFTSFLSINGSTAVNVKRLLYLIPPEAIKEYLINGSLPFWVNSKDFIDSIRETYLTVEHSIYHDLMKLYGLNPETVEKTLYLLLILARTDTISHSYLAKMLNISKPVLLKILEGLRTIGLITPVYPIRYSGSRYLRRSPRYYFVAPSIRSALLYKFGFSEAKYVGNLIRDTISMYTKILPKWELFYTSSTSQRDRSTDFIIKTNAQETIQLDIKRQGDSFNIVLTSTELNRSITVPIEIFLIVLDAFWFKLKYPDWNL